MTTPEREVWVVEVKGAPVDAYISEHAAIDSSYASPHGKVEHYVHESEVAGARENALRSVAALLVSYRCGDNSCTFGPPGGMGTNGDCHCARLKLQGFIHHVRDSLKTEDVVF